MRKNRHAAGNRGDQIHRHPGDLRAFIGDVAWQLEGIRQPAERPLLMRKLADVDPGQVREDLLRVASLAGLMQVVPAHAGADPHLNAFATAGHSGERHGGHGLG